MVKSGGDERSAILLALETATPLGSVALWRDGHAYEMSMRIHGSGAERILPAVDRALEATETGPDQVTGFVVGSGPGSFTGVRIAASMAKGWSMARGTELFAYSSLMAVAAGCGTREPVCALFDARRGQVYAACYEFTDAGPEERLAPGAWRVDELIAELSGRGLRPVFAGEGALVYRAAIAGALPDACVLPPHLAVPRAASLLWLRQVAPDLGRVDDPESWEPIYVRDWKIPGQQGER